MFDFSAFSSAHTWVSLLTLTFMEIVLGIDNIIFISIVVNRLPHEQQKRGRTIGLLLALVFRVGLLLSITWIVGLKEPLFTLKLPFLDPPAFGVAGRDLILLAGGLFLLAKSTTEIHTKLQGEEEEMNAGNFHSLTRVIIQIVLIDIVFSFDSILTAVGLVDNVLVMILAVVLAMGIMLAFSGYIGDFVNNNPTIKILALSFLIMIGIMLVMEAFHKEIEKGYVYFAMAFSLVVELLNMRMRKKTVPVHLRDSQFD